MTDDDFGDFEAVPIDACQLDVPAQPVKHDSSSSYNAPHVSCTPVSSVTSSGTLCTCSKLPERDCGLCMCSQSLANSALSVCGLSANNEDGELSSSMPQRDDSFDDFQQAGDGGTICQEARLSTLQEDSDDDGFADFECMKADCSVAVAPEVEDDGGGANFASTEGASLVGTHLEDSSTETLVSSAFPAVVLVTEEQSSAGTDVRLLEEHEAHKRLWKDLQDLDQAASLQHQWETSISCQYLLRSLNIDSRNILRSPSVPLFAMHLGMLEPQRGDTASVGTRADCPPSPPHQESIPPAQFDWRSSGLENPLEQLSSSSLLDLEFLSSLSPSTSAPPRTSSLEEEFLGDAPEAVNSPKLPPQLQELLAYKAPNIISRPSELSAEASRLLDQLPDLSFMRATVLMFPVRL